MAGSPSFGTGSADSLASHLPHKSKLAKLYQQTPLSCRVRNVTSHSLKHTSCGSPILWQRVPRWSIKCPGFSHLILWSLTTQMAPSPQTLHQWAPALPLPFSIATEPWTPVCLLSLCPFVLLSPWFTSQHPSSLLSAALMQSSTEGGWLEKLVHIFSSHRASENTLRKREYRILERGREKMYTGNGESERLQAGKEGERWWILLWTQKICPWHRLQSGPDWKAASACD